jgi:hypothetical protein
VADGGGIVGHSVGEMMRLNVLSSVAVRSITSLSYCSTTAQLLLNNALISYCGAVNDSERM